MGHPTGDNDRCSLQPQLVWTQLNHIPEMRAVPFARRARGGCAAGAGLRTRRGGRYAQSRVEQFDLMRYDDVPRTQRPANSSTLSC
ncbi:hypothetical protein EVAR_68255_1 [Eumeta japonica]|uniref:Uncharacterized protein n=1 Tax=Eumeta variegata TaxID=151549 RepID=A0A4C1ZVE2_EUMVA|nr:hypothetical protein EVAR_68255_1 [Eumeta japonica]